MPKRYMWLVAVVAFVILAIGVGYGIQKWRAYNEQAKNDFYSGKLFKR
jgi:predicted RND superfamily exporter protein